MSGIKFINNISPIDDSNLNPDNAVRKDKFDKAIEDKLEAHLKNEIHVTEEIKNGWNSKLDKSGTIVAGGTNVFGKITYNEKGLVVSVDTKNLDDIIPQHTIPQITGLEDVIESLIPEDEDRGFIFDIVPNDDNTSVGITRQTPGVEYHYSVKNKSLLPTNISEIEDIEIETGNVIRVIDDETHNGYQYGYSIKSIDSSTGDIEYDDEHIPMYGGFDVVYHKIDSDNTRDIVYITIPNIKEGSEHFGLLTKELYNIYKLILDKIDAVYGKLTVLPIYDFGKSDLETEDFATYIAYLNSLGMEIELKQGLTVHNKFDNSEWVYDETLGDWILYRTNLISIATSATPGIFMTNSDDDDGIELDIHGSIKQKGLQGNIGDKLDQLVDNVEEDIGEDYPDALYYKLDDKTMKVARDLSSPNDIIHKNNIVIDNPELKPKDFLKLEVVEDTPRIVAAGITDAGVDVALLTPLMINNGNINTELRLPNMVTDVYYSRYVCYRNDKFGMVTFYQDSSNRLVVTGILSDKERSYTFTYNSGFMTNPYVVPIDVVASNKNKNSLSILKTESGYDINTCIAFFVLRNGVKLGLLNIDEFNEFACSSATADTVLSLRGYRFTKNDIVAFYFSTLFNETTIGNNFLYDIKTLQDYIVIPESVILIGNNFMYKSGVVSLNLPSALVIPPLVTNFCNDCTELNEIICKYLNFEQLLVSGIDNQFLTGINRSISYENGITLTGLNDIEVENIITRFPNNNKRKINTSAGEPKTQLVLTLDDDTVIEIFSNDDLNKCCTQFDSNAVIEINGIEFAKNQVVSAKLNTGWVDVAFPNNFLRNFSSLEYFSGIPNGTMVIGDNFLMGTNINHEIIIPDTVSVLGGGFLTNCESFSHPLDIPASVNSIGSYLLYNAKQFTQLYVTPGFVDAITPSGNDYYFLASDDSASPMYEQGVTIHGLTTAGLTALTNRFNDSDVYPYYRNINKNNYQLKLILDDNSIVYAISTTDVNLTVNKAVESSITLSGITFTIDRVKSVEFGPGWSNTTIPNNFLKNFTGMEFLGRLPGNVTTIGTNFLLDCSSFNSNLRILNNITSIGTNFMNGCTSFDSELTLSNTLKTIASEFMTGCTSFSKSLIMPKTVTSIGTRFMANCDNFTKLIVSSGFETMVPSSSTNILGTTNPDAPMYTDGVMIVGLNKSEMETLMAKLPDIAGSVNRHIINIFEDNPDIILISSDHNVIIISRDDLDEMNTISGSYATPNDIISNNVTRADIETIYFGEWEEVEYKNKFIPEKFLYNFTNLKNMNNLPNNITEIKSQAFMGCKELKSITLPLNVNLIGDSFAYNCYMLSNVNADICTFDIVRHREISDIRTLADNIDSSNRVRRGLDLNIEDGDDVKEIYCDNDVYPYRNYASSILTLYKTNGDPIFLMPDDVDLVCNKTSAGNITLSGGTTFNMTDIATAQFTSGWFLTEIPDGFLNYFTKLTVINDIPDDLTKIGNKFLYNCSLFNNPIILSSGLTEIGDSFLHGCASFDSTIGLPSTLNTIGNDFLRATKFNKPLSLPSSIKKIGDGFIRGSTTFNQSVNIPSGLINLGEYFLAECTSFNTSVIIPSGINTIPNYFLSGCTSFNIAITIPSTILNIGTYFMNGCTMYDKYITIPETVNSIADGFMHNCHKLTIANFNNKTTITGNYSFSATVNTAPMYVTGISVFGLSEAEFTTLLTSIPNRTSNPFRKLKHPKDGAKLILNMANDNSAFALSEEDVNKCCTNTPSNTTITLNGVTFAKSDVVAVEFGLGWTEIAIPDNFLRNFTNLKTLSEIKSTVKTIGSFFLAGCLAFDQTISIPSGINTEDAIGEGFMYNCINITELKLTSSFITAITADHKTLSVDENFIGEAGNEVPAYSSGISIMGLTTSDFETLTDENTGKLPNLAGTNFDD